MKKKSKRKVRPAEIPCILMDHLSPDSKIMILTSLQAFVDGWAKPPHFDTLLDARDMLLLGAKAKQEEDTVRAARAFNVALANLQDSWDGDKFYPDKDELNALKLLVDISNDFWSRQSGHLYHVAFLTLKQWRSEQHEEKSKQFRANETRMVHG